MTRAQLLACRPSVHPTRLAEWIEMLEVVVALEVGRTYGAEDLLEALRHAAASPVMTGTQWTDGARLELEPVVTYPYLGPHAADAGGAR